MTSATAKISSKGQITLPVAMRRKLGTERVRLTMRGDQVLIEAYTELGGSLARYAKPGLFSLQEETERAEQAAAHEYGKKNPRR